VNVRRVAALCALLPLTLLAIPASAVAFNDAPTCFGTTTAVEPGGERTWSLRCRDVDGPRPPAVTIDDEPAFGTLTVIGGTTVRYRPNAGYTGADSFRFHATDGEDDAATITEEILVTRDDLAPECLALDTRAVNGFVDLGHPCYDPNEGDAAIPELAELPDHGKVRFVHGAYRVQYDADPGHRGEDVFQLRASDGDLTGAGTEIRVESVDLAPPACEEPAPIPVRNGLTKTLLLDCRDNAPGPWSPMALNFEIVDPPDHGTYRLAWYGNAYRPNDGYEGTDQMTVRPSRSGVGDGPPVTISFVVDEDANEPPVCTTLGPVRVRTASTQFVSAGCSDPDGDALATTFGPAPTHGRMQNLLYTADDGYAGADSFALHADDGRATASVTQPIQVVGDHANLLPDCRPVARRLLRDTSFTVAPNCTDADADAIAYEWTQPAANHGTLTANGASALYEPDDGYVGEDSFTFTASDGHGETAPVTVLVRVVAPGAPECPAPPTHQVRTNKDLGIMYWCAAEEAPAYPAVTDSPDHGTLQPFGLGQWNYVPDQDYQGPDSFTVRATSNGLHTDVTHQIVVSDAANTAPSCSAHAHAVTRQLPIDLSLACYDAEDDALTFTLVDGPDNGALGAWDPGSEVATYDPDEGFVGVDELTFKVTDDHGADSRTVLQRVRVAPADENAAPLCSSTGTGGAADADINVQLNCYDGDGDALTYTVVDEPDHGDRTAPSGGFLTYHSDPGFEGVDEIRFTASDGKESSGVATIQIRVGPQWSVFTLCSSLAANVDHGVSRRLRLSCSPVLFGPSPAPEIVDGPDHGTLVADGGWWRYRPDAGFTGVDTFTYRADFTGSPGPLPPTQSPATVELHVRPAVSGGDRTTTEEPPPPPMVTLEPRPAPPGDPPPASDPARDLAAGLLGGSAFATGLSLGGARAFVPGELTGGTMTVNSPTEKLLAIVCAAQCEVTAGKELTFATGGPRAAAKRRVTLRTQRIQLAAGRAGVVTLRLTRAQRKRLKRVRRATLKLMLAVKPAGGRVVRDTVRLRLRA
jgi:Bacterial Ig domain